MNVSLLKQLGNIDQIAGIRESVLLRGRGEQMHIAEFYNAAGLRFTVVPDRCMDVFDLSYKGVNLSFQSKNGLTSPQAYTPADGEFAEQWPAGMLVTCGLGNVGGHSTEGGVFPTHGRISHVPAKNFGTRTFWDGDNYVPRAAGEVHQTKMYSRHLSLQRTIETGLNDKVIKFHDIITNFDAADEPYMMLYHFNFGYPLLQADSCVETSKADLTAGNDMSNDYHHMMAPVDGRGEEMYYRTNLVAFDTKNLPNMLQWKMMKSHDYVLALEPCNTWGMNRKEATDAGNIAVLPAYSPVENHLELGVLDGVTEIRAFIKNL